MRSWIVRFASLYVFNVVVLLVIGLLTPARVGWAVIWAAVVMTLAELFVRPLLQRLFRGAAAKSASQRTRIGEALVQGLLVLAVAAIIWIITLLLSGAGTGGSWFWAWVLPPVIITIGWFVYARIDTRLQARAGAIYDRALSRPGPAATAATGTASTAASTGATGRAELQDGLTAEQRRLLDELGT